MIKPPFFELSSVLKSIIVNARICLLSFLRGEIPVGQTKAKMTILFSYSYMLRVQTIKQCIWSLLERIHLKTEENQHNKNLEYFLTI